MNALGFLLLVFVIAPIVIGLTATVITAIATAMGAAVRTYDRHGDDA